MQTIVVGYDGGDPANRALGRALDIAEAFRARLVVVTVDAIVPNELLAADPGFALAPAVPVGAFDEGEEPGETASHAEAQAKLRGVTCEVVTRIGAPAEELVAVANEEHADLIVVGTREPGFVERLFAGSVSGGVAKKAHCDVLIVHPAHADA